MPNLFSNPLFIDSACAFPLRIFVNLTMPAKEENNDAGPAEDTATSEAPSSKATKEENPEDEKIKIKIEDEEEENDPSEGQKSPSVCLKINFKRYEDEYSAWYKFFKEDVGVEVPSIQLPAIDDQWICFKMHSVADKQKLFQYIKKNTLNGKKLTAKTVNFDLREAKNEKKKLPLPLDEALDIIYPLRNVLYTDQLQEKFVKIKKIVEENILPLNKYLGVKKYIKKFKTENIVPFSPLDGYENNVLIYVEKTADGEVMHGIRVLNADKTRNTLVPLEHCMAVPRQIIVVAKKIVNGLVSAGLEPFCFDSMEGELLGFTIRISDQGTFMLTTIVKKLEPATFHTLTPDGIVPKEGKELGEPYSAQLMKLTIDTKNKLTKFYEDEGQALGVRSIYLSYAPENVLQYQMAARVLYNISKPEHAVGETQLMEKINGVALSLPWDRERHTEAFISALHLFNTQILTNNTKIILISSIRIIGYYFAKKCLHVCQLSAHNPDILAGFKSEAVKNNVKNIDYHNFHYKLKKPPTDNTIVVWWPFLCTTLAKKNKRVSLLQQLLDAKYTNMVFLSFWNKIIDNVDLLQTQMEPVYSKLKVHRIVPFDTEPYKEGAGLFLHFKGFLGSDVAAPSKTQAFKKPINKNQSSFPNKKGFQLNFKKGIQKSSSNTLPVPYLPFQSVWQTQYQDLGKRNDSGYGMQGLERGQGYASFQDIQFNKQSPIDLQARKIDNYSDYDRRGYGGRNEQGPDRSRTQEPGRPYSEGPKDWKGAFANREGSRDYPDKHQRDPYSMYGDQSRGRQQEGHLSALRRLGPRESNFDVGESYASSKLQDPYAVQGPAMAQMQEIAGVMKNVQSMAEQMKVLLEAKQAQPFPEAFNSNWSRKRAYPEDDGFPEAAWDRRPTAKRNETYLRRERPGEIQERSRPYNERSVEGRGRWGEPSSSSYSSSSQKPASWTQGNSSNYY